MYESPEAFSISKVRGKNPNKKQPGFKPKDLMLVPHRVAIALQEWGWWVRSDIVWHKPNPMPESVTDRPTKSHEYIFLLTKNKNYYYDADAIREQAANEGLVVSLGEKSMSKGQSKGANVKPSGNALKETFTVPAGRNKRTVWTIITKPYKGAHFATFPPEIPETCIKAGTSEKGVCPVCGNQWERVTEKETTFEGGSGKAGRSPEDINGKWGDDRYGKNILLGPVTHITTGWKPTCEHNEEPVPATVLDNFGGSGTTSMVANQLGRHGISLDLSWEYLQLAKERTGIKLLQEWETGKKAEVNLEDLPLFTMEAGDA